MRMSDQPLFLMSSPDDHFSRLARLARRAPEPTPNNVPPSALAHQVLARLRTEDRTTVSAWEWLSLRALPLAAAMAAICVFLNDDLTPNRPEDELRLAQAMIQEQLAP